MRHALTLAVALTAMFVSSAAAAVRVTKPLSNVRRD